MTRKGAIRRAAGHMGQSAPARLLCAIDDIFSRHKQSAPVISATL
jgi:hypothetical protein